MALILGIETATKNCSVALFNKGKLVSLREENSNKYLHGEKLTVFINDLLKLEKTDISQLDAIVLSKGPGSYTGLRIGTSTAKGLCYALEIPLITITTLRSMAYRMAKESDCKLFCPMIDARRMEVFSAIYDKNNKQIREVNADIVDHQTYSHFLQEKTLFFGDGSLKCEKIIINQNAEFLQGIFPSAKDLGELGYEKFINNKFEDIAYFEPYYLKDFVVGKKG